MRRPDVEAVAKQPGRCGRAFDGNAFRAARHAEPCQRGLKRVFAPRRGLFDFGLFEARHAQNSYVVPIVRRLPVDDNPGNDGQRLVLERDDGAGPSRANRRRDRKGIRALSEIEDAAVVAVSSDMLPDRPGISVRIEESDCRSYSRRNPQRRRRIAWRQYDQFRVRQRFRFRQFPDRSFVFFEDFPVFARHVGSHGQRLLQGFLESFLSLIGGSRSVRQGCLRQIDPRNGFRPLPGRHPSSRGDLKQACPFFLEGGIAGCVALPAGLGRKASASFGNEHGRGCRDRGDKLCSHSTGKGGFGAIGTSHATGPLYGLAEREFALRRPRSASAGPAARRRRSRRADRICRLRLTIRR